MTTFIDKNGGRIDLGGLDLLCCYWHELSLLLKNFSSITGLSIHPFAAAR